MSECQIWTGAFKPKGYGSVGKLYAHRLAYEAAHGPIPEGIEIHHTCGNKACVNPEHLEPVTRQQHKKLHARKAVERGVVCPRCGTDRWHLIVRRDRPNDSWRCMACAARRLLDWKRRKRESLAS